MFTFGREALALALAEAKAKNEQHHIVNCPQCRRAIKLQVREMQRRLPPDYPLPEWTLAQPAEDAAAQQDAAAKT